MFTGIIEEIGYIKKIDKISGGIQFTIQAHKILSDLQIDHSVSVSGVCLTAVEVAKDGFKVHAVGETLEKSTLKSFNIGQKINLERALQLSDRLGGHFVQGHINAIGQVNELIQRGENWYLVVHVPAQLQKYLIEEGSIAIDGMSLTIANLNGNQVGLSVIPHTYKNTIIKEYKINQSVNIETDFLAKYIENFIQAYSKNEKSNLTMDRIRKLGF